MLMNKQRITVLLSSACVLYTVIYLMVHDMDYMLDYTMILISSTTLNLSLILDNYSLSFCAVVMFIASCVFMFARFYMENDIYYFRFIWVLLMFVLSMNVLILSGSFITLMLGWDGLGVSSFALIIYYQSKVSKSSGFITLLINRLGDILIMSTFFLFCLMGHSLLVNYYHSVAGTLLLLFVLASLTKSAQYPFSVWLPAAMAAPTPVSALVHSSTLVTAGVYILVRSCNTMEMSSELLSILLFCGSVTSFIGGACAMVENDIKKIIALSTLSQLGIMMFSLGMGAYTLTLLHLFTHAMFKALLFLVAGAILMVSFGVQDIRLLGAVTSNSPMLLVMMNMSTFCLMGLPFLSAFFSKHMILNVMWSSNLNLFAIFLMVISTAFTTIYMMRFLKCLNWGNKALSISNSVLNLYIYFPMMILFCGSMLSGYLFTYIDKTMLMPVFLPSYVEMLISTMLLISIFLGYIYRGRYTSKMLTSMMYTVPVWYNSPKMYYMVSKEMKYLDSGWLEVYNLGKSMKNMLQLMTNMFTWPHISYSFMPYCLFMLIITCYYLSM